jgi:hypothetical protein
VTAALQVAEKVLFVIPSEARDLLFFSTSKKQQIPRAKTALRNDKVRVFPQPVYPLRFHFAVLTQTLLLGWPSVS